MLLHPNEAGSNSRVWPCSASAWFLIKSVYWWRRRQGLALTSGCTTFGHLFFWPIVLEEGCIRALVGHGSYLEAGVLELIIPVQALLLPLEDECHRCLTMTIMVQFNDCHCCHSVVRTCMYGNFFTIMLIN